MWLGVVVFQYQLSVLLHLEQVVMVLLIITFLRVVPASDGPIVTTTVVEPPHKVSSSALLPL